MIGLTNLPTDNLYKLLAVAGIALLVVGLVGPFILDQQEIEWSWWTLQEIEDRLDEKTLKVADLIARENLADDAKVTALLSRDLQFGCGTELRCNQLGELGRDICHRIV